MFAGIRKRLARKQNEKDCDDDDKDDVHDIMPPPPNYIQISQGKIQLVHQPRSLEHDTISGNRSPATLTLERGDKDVLEKRMLEVEGALLRLQEQFHKVTKILSYCRPFALFHLHPPPPTSHNELNAPSLWCEKAQRVFAQNLRKMVQIPSPSPASAAPGQ
ncbi:hypothetical protein ACLKA7_000584 [Drosophila subpalustris]